VCAKLKGKLFPRKNKEKDELVIKAKAHIRKIALANKTYNKRAEIARKNAKIAIKRGERNRAKNYLIQHKQYQMKVDRANNIRAKIERQIEAIEEGQMISMTGDLMGGIRDELKTIASSAAPEKVAEIAEDSESYVAEIEESWLEPGRRCFQIRSSDNQRFRLFFDETDRHWLLVELSP